jgi:hypothetical protein
MTSSLRSRRASPCTRTTPRSTSTSSTLSSRTLPPDRRPLPLSRWAPTVTLFVYLPLLTHRFVRLFSLCVADLYISLVAVG